LVEEAIAGKEIIIGKAGRPMVVLTPWRPRRSPRVGGQLAGQIWEAEDCWTDGSDLLSSVEREDPNLTSPTAWLRVAEDPST
jgi:antitoxin (DNA-binding transcriptional repressor) of toxin-antitoxin stability system